jgi:predicted metalloprotease
LASEPTENEAIMRWTPQEQTDIEDRRGQGGMMRRGAPLGIGGLLILLVLSYVTGTDFLSLLGSDAGQVASGPSSAPSGELQTTPQEEEIVKFMNVVMRDAQATWGQLLGTRYQRTVLVLFRQGTESGCGVADSGTGPFYCPADQKVYLDLSFFEELDRRFGAPGDFAQAYVVAHELGHHVQTLLGTNSRVQQLQQSRPDQANELSVRLELQADCFAGVWGHATAQPGRPAGAPTLDPDDVDEGLRAAAAIGDDRLQKESGRGIRPESFTHGSSQQRVSWLKRGLESGDPRTCDTFGGGGTN